MVNADSIGTFMQADKTRYKTNWLGTTKSLKTGKNANIKAVFYRLDPDITPPDEAVAMFEQERYVELLQRPEGETTFLRFAVFHDTDYDAVFVQVESYVSRNVLSGISDAVEVTEPQLKADVLAEMAKHKTA